MYALLHTLQHTLLHTSLYTLQCVHNLHHNNTHPPHSKQVALQELSEAEAQAGKRVAELEEVALAEGKKYGSVAEECEAKGKKLDKLEKRLGELQADIRDAYRDFQAVHGGKCVGNAEGISGVVMYGNIGHTTMLPVRATPSLCTITPPPPNPTCQSNKKKNTFCTIFHQEKESLLDQIRGLQQQVELKEMLCELFIPPRHVSTVRKTAVWDDVSQVWKVPLTQGQGPVMASTQVCGIVY